MNVGYSLVKVVLVTIVAIVTVPIAVLETIGVVPALPRAYNVRLNAL